MVTTDVVKEIIGLNNEIARIRLIKFEGQKDVRRDMSDVWTPDDECVYEQALKLRKEYNVPFWHGVMIGCMDNPQWSEHCLTASLAHNAIHYVADVAVDDVDCIVALSASEERIALNSEVVLVKGGVRHIPMLDFHIPCRQANTDVVREVCGLLGKPGYILSSGQSYHFIGKYLFSYVDMIDFMARALLFAPITDGIWIAHQLQYKSCSLRIGRKNGVYPELICEV